MNKKGDIELKDFGAMFLIYILLISTIATSSGIAGYENKSSEPIIKNPIEKPPIPQEEIEASQSEDNENKSTAEEEEIFENQTNSYSEKEENETIDLELDNGQNETIKPEETNHSNPEENSTNQSSSPIKENQTEYNITLPEEKNNSITNSSPAQPIEIIENDSIEEEPEYELIQHQAKLNEPVKWTKRIYEKEIQQERTFSISSRKNYTEEIYETEAPRSIEKQTANGKEVLIYSQTHYTNVIAFTDISESLNIQNPNQIKIIWKEQSQEIVPTKLEDTNNNSIIDYVEWIAPHLSSQTFEIILITKASHLDENKNFIQNIFEEVSALDNIYSPIISENEFVRITFEHELDNTRDITIYSKTISGNPKIEVYELNTKNKVAEFTNLKDGKNKVYLSDLEGLQDTFELKILSGEIQFDYITDPQTDFEDWESYSDSDSTLSGSFWQNIAGDDCDMMTDSAGTPSSGTGPTVDNTLKTSSGEYLYLETSSGYCMGDGLYSDLNGSEPLNGEENAYNISFYYHMVGSTMGSFQLDVYNGTWQTAWSVSGEQQSAQGDEYIQEIVDLSEYETNFTVRLRFISGGNYYGDIAVDDINISYKVRNFPPSTPTSLTCNGASCNGKFIDSSVEINCSGSVDPDSDQVTYIINTTSGYIGNHTDESSLIWNTSLEPESSTANFTCQAIDLQGSEKTSSLYMENTTLTIDHTIPKIAFASPTNPNATSINAYNIPINLTLTESNFQNITFYLYDSSQEVVDSKAYTSKTSHYIFGDKAAGSYFYNAITFDKAGHRNSTETRKITLDRSNPSGSQSNPSSGTHSNQQTQNLTTQASDTQGLKQAILHIFNSSNQLINQTIISIQGTSLTIGIIYTFLIDGIYSWFYKIVDQADNSYNTPNQTIIIDTTPSVIQLESTLNNPGTSTGNIQFDYNISDNLSEIENCSLILNEATDQTKESIAKNSIQNFQKSSLPAGKYNFSIRCFDEASNPSSSQTKTFSVIPMTSFSGDSTDISQTNVSAIQNFTLENSFGKIIYSEILDLSSGPNLNQLVSISEESISVNSSAEPNLNKSATLIFYNLSYQFKPVPLKNQEICQDCQINYYNDNLSFNVSSFSNYTLSENSKLEIWDETDVENKYPNEQILFYANYTNKTSSESISGTGVFCNITFDSQEHQMTFNSSVGLYQTNKSFSIYGIQNYQINCYGATQGYENISSQDSAVISFNSGSDSDSLGYKTQSGVYNFAGTDEYIPLDYPIQNISHAFVMAPNMQSQGDEAQNTNLYGSYNSDDALVTLYLYNNTHIRAQRYTSSEEPAIVTWQVLEAMGEEFEVQRGSHSFSSSGTTTSTTIPQIVNPDNSMTWHYVRTSYTADDGRITQFYTNLTNNNTLEFTRSSTSAQTLDFRWIVVEWDISKISSLQKGLITQVDGDDTAPVCTTLDTSVNKSSSFMFHNVYANTDDGLDASSSAGYIQDDNSVCFYNIDTDTYYSGVKWTLIDFGTTGPREENIHTDLASGTYIQNMAFSNTYNTNNSLFWASGTCNGDGTAKPRHTFWWNFSSTGATIEKTYSGQATENSWQILQLPYFENLDTPIFSNPQSNQSFAKDGESVRFSIDVTDSDGINWTRGIIEETEHVFQNNSQNYYYDFLCSENKIVYFSYISAQDLGYPIKANSSSISNTKVTCDSTAPTVAFQSPTPENGHNSNESSFQISLSIQETNFQEVIYSLYNDSTLLNQKAYYTPISEIEFSGLGFGTYYYNATVIDKAGNLASTPTRTIGFDPIAPVVEFSSPTPESGTTKSEDQLSLNITVTEPNEKGVTFYIYDNEGLPAKPIIQRPAGTRTITWTLLPDGLYYYNATVEDNFQNFGSTETRNITLDNLAPQIQFIDPTEENNTYFRKNWIYAKASLLETNFQNITFSLYNKTSLVSNLTLTDSTREITWNSLPDETYFYNISSTDKAGNTNQTETRKITLDNVDPIISFGTGTESDWINLSQSFIFINTSLTESNPKNITFYLYSSNGLFNETTITSGNQITFQNLPSDIYYYNATAYDKVGQFGSTPTRAIGLDTTGPKITIINPKPIAYGIDTGLPLDYTVSDQISQVDSCWWNLNNGINNSITCGTNTTFDTSDGSHTLNFYSNDTFGHESKKSVSFLVSTGGPAIVLNEPINDTIYASSREVFFNYSAIDVQSVSTCSLYGDWNGGWHLNQTDANWDFGISGDDFEDWETYADSDTTLSGSIWQNVAGDDCDMMTDSAGTPSTGTGPDIDNTLGTSLGEYLYLETSSGYCMGDGLYAELNGTQILDADTYLYNVSFWYHMTGSTMGSFHLDVFNGTWQNSYWSISGQQQTSTTDAYDFANVDLSEFSGDIYVRFRFISGGNYYGDIAVDDLKINWEPRIVKTESNFTLNLNQEGNYFWNIECNDTLNLFSTALANYSVAIDLTDPIVNFTTNTPENSSRTNQNSIFIEANLIETNPKNITFYLYDETSLLEQTSYEEKLNTTFTGLTSGIYYYNITAFDKSGRSGYSETRQIQIDVTDPTATLISPVNNYFTSNPTQNYIVNVSDLVELESATLFILNSTNGLVYSNKTSLSGQQNTTLEIPYTFTYDDVFSWLYQVTDDAGNQINTSSRSIEIDSTNPVISFIPTTASVNAVLKQDFIYLNTSVYEKNFKNLTFYLYDDEHKIYEYSYSNSIRQINWTTLADDTYYYNVSSTDKAGNTGVSQTRKITLDNNPPIVNFAPNSHENNSVITGTSIFINATVSESNEQSIQFNLYNEDGSLYGSSPVYTDLRRTYTFTFVPEASYFYNVTVIDKVGLKGSSQTRKITLDNQAPTLEFITPTLSSGSNQSQNFIFLNTITTEDNIENITFNLYDETSLVSSQTYESQLFHNFTDISDGNYFYNATIFDKAGQSSSTLTRTINLDTINPQIQFEYPTANDGENFLRDWIFINTTTTEENFRYTTIYLYDTQGLYEQQTIYSSQASYNFTSLPSSVYYYNATSIDYSGNFNSTSTRMIGLDFQGPIINIISPESKTYGYNESISLTHTVSDLVSSVDSCWWNIDNGINESISCNSPTTFNTTEGSHTINFYANDTFSNMAYESVSFFISLTGPAVQLFNPEDNTFFGESSLVNFTFTAWDPDSIDSCSLYGNWNEGWHKNETFSSDWATPSLRFRKNITILNTGSTELADYPAYINISRELEMQNDFDDIRFYSGSCGQSTISELDFELEYYDSESADVWVSLSALPTTGTTICMYYGNSDADSYENPTGVWNSDYGIVYHMDEVGEDSTSNNNDKVSDYGSPENDDSFLGEGISFSENNAWDQSDLSYWESAFSTKTHEVIFETSLDISSRQAILAEGGGTNGVLLYILSGNLYARWWSESDSMTGVSLNTAISANTKYHAVMTYDYPGNYQLYLNGVLVGSGTTTTGISAHSGNGGIGYTNTAKDFDDGSNTGAYFTGSIFELRVSDNEPSQDWVNQTYQSIFEDTQTTSFSSPEELTAFQLPFDIEGTYVWNVECNDTNSYNSFALENYTFKVDVTAPQVFFSTPPTEPNNTAVGQNWINMQVNLIENNFKNITFNLYDETSLLSSNSYTDSTRQNNFTNLEDGIYYYNVTVFDQASHVGYSETRKISLDTEAPQGTLTSPPQGSNTKETSINFTGYFSDATGLLNATLYVFNEAGYLIYTAFQELNGALASSVGLIYSGLLEGIYQWMYKIEDVVGNNYETANNTLIVDLTAPQISFTVGTLPSGEIKKQESIFANVTSSDIYFDNLTFYLYDESGLVNPPGPVSYMTPNNSIEWTGLADGIYYYNATVFDEAGNKASTTTRNITLDNTAPEIDFSLLNQENEALIAGDTISVYVTATEPNEENITFNLYDENHTIISSNTYTDSRRSASWNLLPQGTYYYNVTIFDEVGLSASTTTREITLDSTSPKISYGYNTEANNTFFSRDWIFVRINVVEDDFKNSTINLYNESGLITSQSFLTEYNNYYNWTGLPDGQYYYNATTYDAAGNFNSTTTRTITLDNQAPEIEFTLPTKSNFENVTDNWIFTNVSISELNFQNITFGLYDSSGLVDTQTYTTQTTSLNFTNLPSKNYWYNVTTYDKAGNSNSTLTRKIGLDFQGPSIAIINPKPKAYGANESLPLDYTVYDNIVGTDTCWYNIDHGDNTTISCSGSTTFNTSDGGHTLHFYANDTFGNTNYKNVTFLISVTGPAIQLITPEDKTFYSEGSEILFNYTAEDPDMTRSCSLYGSWNGGWHLNQTDYDWIKGFYSEVDEDLETASPWENWTEVGDGAGCLWTRGTTTSSGNTGPSGGYGPAVDSGSYFLYTEASSGQNCEFDTGSHWTSLESDFLDADSYNITLNFWYHMYGAAIGSLYVDVNDSSGWDYAVWSLSGQQQTSETAPWEETVVNLEDYSGDIKIRVRAVVGSAYTSDISIDQLKITQDPKTTKTSGNFTLEISEEGTHNWNVECNDSLGYYTWAVSNYSITFDVTDPVVNFGANTLPDNTNVSQDYIFINSSIIENNFKNITFYLYNSQGLVDSEWFNDSTRDYSFTELSDDTYYYNITVFDSAARKGISSTRAITLDTTAPSGSPQSPANNLITNNATQNLTAYFSDASGLSSALLYVYNQTTLVDLIPASISGAAALVSYLYTFLFDGVYQWFFEATDLMGNSYNTTSRTITVDTLSPQINFIEPTLPNNSFMSQEFIYLNTSVLESSFKNITFILSGPYPSTNTFTSSKRDINWTNRPEGQYHYKVQASDIAGNTNSSEERVITLDTTYPQISYASPTPQNYANLSQNHIPINTSILETNFQNITFRLLGDSPITYTDSTRAISYSPLLDGTYTYNASTCDKAGQCSNLPTRTITLDTTDPILFFIDPTNVSGTVAEQDEIYMKTFLTETNFQNITYYLYNETALLNSTTFLTPRLNLTFQAPGTNVTYFYNATIYDIAGNKDSTATRNITLIDTTYPTLSLTNPENKTYTYNTSLRISYDIYDKHLDTCWYRLNYGQNITMPNCQSLTIDVPDEQTHYIEIFANDSMGYISKDNTTFSVNSSLIKLPETYSVQSGSIFVDGTSAVSINEIHPTKGFIIHTTRASDSSPTTLQTTSDFQAPEEIIFQNYDSGAGAIISWFLISGPNITVQRGEIPYTTETTLPLSIGEVDLSESFIIVNSRLNSSTSSDNTAGFWTANFASPTSVNFQRESSSAPGVLSYQIVSWKGSSVQNRNLVISDLQEASSQSITAVNKNESILIFSKRTSESTIRNSMIKGTLDSSEIEFSRIGSSGQVTIEAFVISNPLFEAQHKNHSIQASSSEQISTIPKPLINISRSFDVHSSSATGTTSQFATAYLTQEIHNQTTVALQKGVATGTGAAQWTAVEITELDNPSISLGYPINTANFSSLTIPQFNFTISDESQIQNCSLYTDFLGSWELNQTIENPQRESQLSFSGLTAPTDGYYSWNVACTDVYQNTGWATQNFSFAAFLPPTKPTIYNITQSANDGTGEITLSWNASDHSDVYKIYAGPTISSMTEINQTTLLNYTDLEFAGNKRKFYQIIASNPTGQNSSETFSAHLYQLYHDTEKSRNWIAFPTNASYIAKASDALQEIPQATTFTTFNSTTQSRVTCNEFSCPESFACTSTNCNFEINLAAGYEVDINTSGSQEVNWSIVGRVHEPNIIQLNRNLTSFAKNWIAVSAYGTSSNAQDLILKVPNVDMLSKWDPESQSSVPFGPNPIPLPWMPDFIGINFEINMEEGYEVSVTSSSQWTQD